MKYIYDDSYIDDLTNAIIVQAIEDTIEAAKTIRAYEVRKTKAEIDYYTNIQRANRLKSKTIARNEKRKEAKDIEERAEVIYQGLMRNRLLEAKATAEEFERFVSEGNIIILTDMDINFLLEYIADQLKRWEKNS